MAYQANKPEANDQLSQSQADLQANFQSINTSFNQNHVTFDIADTGKHKFIQLPVQAAAPAAVAGQIDLYNLPLAGTNELYIQNSAGTQIPITKALAANSGWAWLPSGIRIAWGRAAIAAVGAGTVVAFATPFTTACYSVTATDADAFGNRYFVQVNTLAAANFRCRLSDSGGAATAGNINYIAIGD